MTDGPWAALRRQAELAAIGPSLQQIAVPDPPPLSPAQLRLWQLDQLHPGQRTQNLHLTYRLRGPLEVSRLAAALAAVWARHAGLRTTIRTAHGRPYQHLHPPDGWQVDHADGAGEAGARQRAVDLVAAPYALDRDQLFRAGLYRIADADHLLVIGAHHIVFDAWSRDVLHHEVSALYADPATSLLPLRVDYPRYATWQNARIADTDVDTPLRDWWTRYLAGAPRPASLGGTSTAEEGPRPRRRHVSSVAASTVADLRAAARDAGGSLFGALFAGFAALVAGRSGERDAVILSPAAGRTDPALHDLIGYFVNLQPLRADLRDSPDAVTLLRRCAEGASGAAAHQGLPGPALAALYGRAPRTAPLLFGLQNTGGTPLALPDVVVSDAHLECGEADFEVYLNLEPGPGGSLRCIVDYDGATHTGRAISDLVEDYRALLVQLAAGDLRSPAATVAGPIPQPTSQPGPATAAAPTASTLSYLRGQVGLLVGTADVDVEASLLQLGMDSLKLIELAGRIERQL
ncbi:MAG TPA: condensation domain-containing protein, partial [Euzebya sp.]|nr:condensation domain-containing protein [Euzebya sp.]